MTDHLLGPEARIATDRELVRRGTFYDFFRMAWNLIDPAPLVPNWHLEEKCIHLEAVSNGLIRRLVINEPPGSGKSNTVNVLWNVWEWIKRPQTKFLYASFDASLVGTRDGGKVIRLLQTDWFVARWGNVLPLGKPAAHHFQTLAGGFRFATSPSGRGTGRHGNIRVIDDPLKPKDANGGATMTKNALRKVSQWVKDTWASRATDQTTVRDVLIMQRLHDEDLAGEWLAKGDCVHLCFPMLFEAARPCRTQFGGDRRTVEGELLFPARFPLETVIEMRDGTSPMSMGPEVFAAQCQQRPVRKGGGIFKREWWRFWHPRPGVLEPCLCEECFKAKTTLPGHRDPILRSAMGLEPLRECEMLPHLGYQVQSWDCTFKDSEDSDFVSGGTFKVHGPRVFLLDRINERLSFTETVDALRAMSFRFPQAYDKLIEDKANGPAVENVLRTEIPGLTLVTPMGGKIARANAGSIFFSARRFFVPHPEIMAGVYAYMGQHEAFPKGTYDDDVDMTSQVLVKVKTHGEQFAEAMRRLRGEA